MAKLLLANGQEIVVEPAYGTVVAQILNPIMKLKLKGTQTEVTIRSAYVMMVSS